MKLQTAFVPVILLSLQSLVYGQIPMPGMQNSVEVAFQSLMRDPDLKNASVGLYAINMNDSTVVAKYNENLSIVPASVQKLVTTSTALHVFGAGFRFRTYLEHDGYVDRDGTLHGNLFVRGGGDPTLGSRFFNTPDHQDDFLHRWVDVIQAYGIKKITGGVIGDATIYSAAMVPSTWIWGDMGNHFGAGPSGLTVYDNTCHLEFSSGPAGDTAMLVCVNPEIPEMEVYDRVMSSSMFRDDASVFGAPYEGKRVVSGFIPQNQKSFDVRSSIPDPAYLVAHQLSVTLQSKGISTGRLPTTVRRIQRAGKFSFLTAERACFDTIYSPPLADIIALTNQASVNLFAEHLINHIGVRVNHYGDAVSGASAITYFWNSKGLNTGGFNIFDGSGLSRFNTVTALQIASIVQFMMKGPYAKVFEHSLAVGGESGTMASIGKGTVAHGRVKAKSGTLTRVKCYAGIVNTISGKKIAFAFLSNNFNCSTFDMKSKLEKLMIALAKY